jgi:hypothetical protein
MTEARPERPSIFARLREPAALNYFVMTGAGLIVYGMIMMGRGNDAGALIAVLLAVPGILARWTASPILILLLTAYLLIDPGFLNLIGIASGSRWFTPRIGTGFNLEDVILAAALLAYAIGHFRLTSIIHQGMPDEPTSRKERDPLNPPRRPAGLVSAEELPRTLMLAGGCVVAAQAAWFALVLVERSGRPAAFTPGTTRLLIVAWVTGLALMVVSAALVYLRSARMTRNEAALVLRDEFFQENRRETDRLQRWRKWYKERVALRRRAGK